MTSTPPLSNTNPRSPSPQNDEDDDEYIPLTTQRVFGAGISRQPIAFVPATSTESTLPVPPSTPNPSTAAKYLSIVLGQPLTSADAPSADTLDTSAQDEPLCPICRTPVTSTSHESSIAHQLGLEHSHPPSHLDRQRKGLKYLRGYGWDPDSRVGLGAQGEGIRVPIKTKEKRDTVGLGVDTEKGDEDGEGRGKMKKKTKAGEGRVVKLNAKEVRRTEEEKKRKAEKLRGAFYGEDLSQYLGPGW